MLMHAFLPILSILGLGLGIIYIASTIFHFRLEHGDFYLVSVLTGFASIIVPMILVAIFFEGHLGIVPRVHIVSSALVVLLGGYHYLTRNVHRLEHIQLSLPKASGAEYVLSILIVLLLLEYLFLLLLFPLQGFDALDIYLPNALTYYQTDSIPKVNLLTAAPILKEPGHTLLFTYVLYISGRDSYQLIPFLTIVSFTVLAYKFGAVFLGSRRNGLLAAALLLALPLTRELLTVWAYYQDIYVAFFYSAAIYFFLLGFQRKKIGYSIMAGLTTGLAILTKTSGWTLLFILLLLAPSGKRGKALKIGTLIAVATLLAMKAIGTIYVGIVIPIAIIVFILTAVILKMPSQEKQLSKTVVPLSVGVAVGGWWMWRMRTILPQSFDVLIDLYFVVKGSPQWTYPIDATPETLPIKEHMHSLSFLGTCLILFVSAWFAAGWLVPKLAGFFSAASESAFTIWCLGFLAIWFAYYFLISVRYLSVIILPLVLLTAKGTERLYQRLLMNRMPRLALEIFLLTAATFQIRHQIFRNYIFEPPARSITYATNPLAVLIIALGLFLIGIGILIIVAHVDEFLWARNVPSKQTKQWLMGAMLAIFLVLTASAPVTEELFRWRATSWDPDHFHERYLFEYRSTFHELVQAIIAENLPETSIIGANVPGLEFFVQQPVIDLIWGGRLVLESFFTEENVTSGFELLDTLNTGFIISLNDSNYLYERFQTEITSQTYLYNLVNYDSYFQRVFSNQEFILYRITSFRPFVGIVNLKLQAGSEKTSVLGDYQGNFSTTLRPTLVATIDLTKEQWTRMAVVTEVDYRAYMKDKTQIRQFHIERRGNFLNLGIFDFPTANCEIHEVRLTCTLYDANNNVTQEFTFLADAQNPVTVLHRYHWTSANRTSEWVVKAFGQMNLSSWSNLG